MIKEELEKEAIMRVDAFIDNFSQDVRSTLYDRLNQEDVKDFLYGLYIDSAEPRENRIAELEKENAELKEQCSILADCNSCTSSCKTENLEMKKQLTNAKEIIKELVRVEYADFTNGDYSNELSKVLEQAEQFLRETDIDNAIQKANEGLNLDKIAEEIEQDIKEQSNS